jgi:thioredoxin reductase
MPAADFALSMKRTHRMHDTIIVGGSYAGISAGLQLARARRDVLVLDAGQRRNRTAMVLRRSLSEWFGASIDPDP